MRRRLINRLRAWIAGWRLLLLSALMLLLSAPALAADCPSATVLRPGETATCTGVLLPAPWAARALRCTEVDLPRAAADCDLRVALVEAARVEQEKLALAQLTRAQACEDRLGRVAAAVTAPRPWWQSPWLWAPAGLVLGGLAGWGAHSILGR